MTITEIFKQINFLSKDKEYAFWNGANRNTFKYTKRDSKTNALHFIRIKGGAESKVTISERNLIKIANKVRPYIPFQIDVIVGASGNWRSLFESALLYTPQFYACSIDGQRHLIWAPEHEHELDVLVTANTELQLTFAKQSRFYDFQYYMDNCYAFENCYPVFINNINDLLRLFRKHNTNLYSIYDISDFEQIQTLIELSNEHDYQIFHTPLSEDRNFCLFDIAQAYKKFLLAKKYFAYY